MTGEPLCYCFDWRFREHADVTALLVGDQFRSGVGRVLKWAVVSFVIFAALVVVVAGALGDWNSATTLGPWVVAVAAMLLVFAPVTGRLRAWQIRRIDPNVGHPFTYVFACSGLRVRLHTLETELKWDHMHRVRETRTMFLFYYHRRSAYFLPKRVLGHAEDVNRLRGWIRSRLPEAVPYLDS